MNNAIVFRGSAAAFFSHRVWGQTRFQVGKILKEDFEIRQERGYIQYPDSIDRLDETIDREVRHILEENLVQRMNENSQKTQHSIRKRLLEVYPENDFDVAIHFSKGSLVFDIVINILGDLGYIYAAERTAQIAYQSLNTIICNIAESEIKKEITFNKKDAALSNLSILPVNADKKKFSSNQGVDIDLNGSIIELKKIYFAVVSVAILASIALILFLAVLYVSTH